MNLTIGELFSIAKHFREREAARQKAATINAAFTAYYGAYLSRVKRFPQSMPEAFPSLFGRTETGGIPASDWQRAKAEMEKIRLAHNARIKAVNK